MYESNITDVQIVEGVCAIITFIIVWYLFWTKLSFDSAEGKYLASALRYPSGAVVNMGQVYMFH